MYGQTLTQEDRRIKDGERAERRKRELRHARALDVADLEEAVADGVIAPERERTPCQR